MHSPKIKYCISLIAKVVLFAFSVLFFFYAAMFLAVDNYVFEPFYFMLNMVFLTIFTGIFVFLPGPSWLYLLTCYLLAIFPTVITSSYIMVYKTYFSLDAFFFIWESNSQESMEFIKDCFQRFPYVHYWVLSCILFPLCTLTWLWAGMKPLRQIKPFYRLIGSILCGVLFFFLARSAFLKFNYQLSFYTSYGQYWSEIYFIRKVTLLNREKNSREDFISSSPNDQPETYVVVIGESANRHHMSMYGYPRKTDPMMKKRLDQGDLFAFSNVNATFAGTTYSLLQALSFMDQTSDIKEFTYSAIDMFNDAGFKTFWFSNNSVLLRHDTLLQLLSLNASVRHFVSSTGGDFLSMQNGINISIDLKKPEEESLSYDEILLPLLENALQDSSRKKIIFLHLKGSHIRYKYRYPQQFEKFTTFEDIPPRPFHLDGQFLSIINEYDNSIVYTDYLLEKILTSLEKNTLGEKSWMLYFSDHGERVFELGMAYGRDDPGDKYMYDIPLFIWLSKEYRITRDNVADWKNYSNRPYRLDDLIYSLLDIGNLKTHYLDLSRSLFSQQYIMRPRFVRDRLYLDYPPQTLHDPATYEEERKLNQKWLEGEVSL